ncbi:MAG: hypothetical protein U0174_00740 [Polyangiaceae bacterium]
MISLRHSLLLLVSVVSISGALPACGTTPMLYVHRFKMGKKPPTQDGEVLKMQRPDTERFGTAQPGFFALKTREDWNRFWEGNGTPPEPPGIDFQRKMILVAATESSQSQNLRIGKVVETGTSMYVYVTETRPGEGCPLKTGNGVPKQDMVVVDHTEKPVHFYLEADQANSCGDAPVAKVECKVEGSAPAAELMAQTGQTVECTAREEVKGVFAAVDRRWTFKEFPQGSASKLAFDESGRKIKFVVDQFGRYGVHFEVVDDAGRKGDANASIIVSPSKDGLFVRLSWSGFDVNDDPETFPRVTLEAGDAAQGLCSLDPPRKTPWCDMRKETASVTSMQLKATEGGFPLNVKYIDDRFQSALTACVRVFFRGGQTADVCDKEVRKSGDVWNVGVLVAKTGFIEPVKKDEPPPATPPTAKPPKGPPGGAKPPVAGTKPPAPGTKPGKKPGAGIFNP